MFRHEDVFVKPGKGVRVPLLLPRAPGLPREVPKEGCKVERNFEIERLIACGDLLVVEQAAEKDKQAAKKEG